MAKCPECGFDTSFGGLCGNCSNRRRQVESNIQAQAESSKRAADAAAAMAISAAQTAEYESRRFLLEQEERERERVLAQQELEFLRLQQATSQLESARSAVRRKQLPEAFEEFAKSISTVRRVIETSSRYQFDGKDVLARAEEELRAAAAQAQDHFLSWRAKRQLENQAYAQDFLGQVQVFVSKLENEPLRVADGRRIERAFEDEWARLESVGEGFPSRRYFFDEATWRSLTAASELVERAVVARLARFRAPPSPAKVGFPLFGWLIVASSMFVIVPVALDALMKRPTVAAAPTPALVPFSVDAGHPASPGMPKKPRK